MVVYEHYVDDSNQIAKVPPPGSVYDKDMKKLSKVWICQILEMMI